MRSVPTKAPGVLQNQVQINDYVDHYLDRIEYAAPHVAAATTQEDDKMFSGSWVASSGVNCREMASGFMFWDPGW